MVFRCQTQPMTVSVLKKPAFGLITDPTFSVQRSHESEVYSMIIVSYPDNHKALWLSSGVTRSRICDGLSLTAAAIVRSCQASKLLTEHAEFNKWGLVGVAHSVPIRLMQTHTTCRMLPLAILRTQSTPSGCMREADRHGSFWIFASTARLPNRLKPRNGRRRRGGEASHLVRACLGAAHPDGIGDIVCEAVQLAIARQAEDVVDAVGLAPCHGLRSAIVGRLPGRQAGCRTHWPLLKSALAVPDPASP